MINQSAVQAEQTHEGCLVFDENGYPKTLNYYFVAHDWEYLPGHISKQHRLSGIFRTTEEAERFLESCNVEGAGVYQAGFLIRVGDDIAGLQREIFGGPQ
jgi:hypothetical protein